MTTPAVLVVSADGAARARIVKALEADDTEVFAASDALAVETWIGERADRDAIVLVDVDGADAEPAIALLRRCRELHPRAQRVIAIEYELLPNVVRLADRSLVHRVVPRARLAKHAPAIVADVLRASRIVARAAVAAKDAADDEAPFDLAALARLLARTAERVGRIDGVIVRRLDDDTNLGIELVIPSDDLGRLHADLSSFWPAPVKSQGEAPSAEAKRHPVAVGLGGLDRTHALFARAADDDPDVFAYVAVLPWRDRAKATVLVGVHRDDERATLRKIVADLHRHVVDDVAAYPLPMLPSRSWATKPPTAIDEYDWVATESYVGPDRRAGETPFLGPRTVGGRRRFVLRPSELFADGASRLTKLVLVAYVVLVVVDAVLTWRYAGRQGIVEMNPVVARLLARGPWAFFVLKNLAAIAGFAVLVRLERLRVGKFLLGMALLFYVTVDIVWLFVLL